VLRLEGEIENIDFLQVEGETFVVRQLGKNQCLGLCSNEREHT